jgi:hypothetical protein
MAGAAAILAGVAAVGSLTSMGLSFAQASRQRKAAAAAQQRSDAMMREAKRRLETKFFEGLNVPLDAYEKQREMSILGTQTALQALQEGDPRSLAAGVGQIGQVASTADEKMRIGLASDLYENRKFKAEQNQKVNEAIISMNLGQAKQFKQESQDAKEAGNEAIIAGVSAFGEAAALASDATPLFGKGKQNKQIGEIASALKTRKGFENYDESQIQSILKNKASREQIAKYIEDPVANAAFLAELFPEIDFTN